MDVQVQELIDKIKKDGVVSAEKSAETIIRTAEKKASDIVAEAEKKADAIVRAAKAETERMEKASEDALVQASRNMILSFREALVQELNGIVHVETEKAYSKDVLSTLVPEVVKAWAKETDAAELSVLVSAKDLKALESKFTAALKAQISKGLEIKPDKTLTAGFRVGVDNGTAFYDYSADALVELFSGYVNPRITALMKKAAEGID
ncbi:MAG: V-type ATP synthase subunit E [Treponema sp.]|nr:V-type ATP synthase subunit E [Treponema sp.]